MRTTLILLAALAAPTVALAQEPVDAVAFFYANPGSELDEAERERFSDPARAVLDANDVLWEQREDVCIDFSILFDAQDYDEAELERTLAFHEEIDGDVADVFATFSLFGAPREILWSLAYDDGSWKVTDVSSPEAGWRLSELSCE
jgi:hypothetical protein